MNAPVQAQAAWNTTASEIDCINPASGERLGRVRAANAGDVAAAIDRARKAQEAWGRSSFRQRRAVLARIRRHLVAHVDELCEMVAQVSGKTHENALLGEILPACNKLQWLIDNGERHLKPETVGSGLLMHKKGRIEYPPLGVVGCIVPWNYPLQNVISSLGAPLMAGNAVIVKPSEAVAWATPRLQTILDEALSAEGFSTDTVQLVNGYGEAGAALVRGGVQKILFIGSVPNGRRIVAASAETLTPVVVELGGKDPMIVCDDADLEQAVHSALGGCFINLGQNCIASERIIVHDAIHDRYVEEVVRHAAALRQGAPAAPGRLDVGSLCTAQQRRIVDELVSDAIANGARAVVGGKLPDGPGNFYPPTILLGVTPEMRIAREETFGPVLLVMRVRDDAEAIRIANGTEFGLQASVFTKDRQRAERIAAALECGGVCINDYGMCYLNQDLPFGGVKASGFGRMNGRDGLRAYTNARAVLSDRFAFSIVPRLYPVRPADYAKARASIELLYSASLRDRARALWALLWAAVGRPPKGSS